MERITVKEEPVDTDAVSAEDDFALNCTQLCKIQYEAASSDKQPNADPLSIAEPSVKVEPPDISLPSEICSSNTVKQEDVVGSLVVDDQYSTKCEMICGVENEEHDQKEPQPTPSTSAASKAEDNFEFISVGAIKQEKAEWMSDPEDPNPLQDAADEDRKLARLQGKDVQKNWKSLRGCFNREHAAQKKAKAGSGAIKRTTSNIIPQHKAVDETRERKGSDVVPQESSSGQMQHPKKHRHINFEEEIWDILQKRRKRVAEEMDEDKAFLMSLLPTLKSFIGDDKLAVRMQIMNAMRQVQMGQRSFLPPGRQPR